MTKLNRLGFIRWGKKKAGLVFIALLLLLFMGSLVEKSQPIVPAPAVSFTTLHGEKLSLAQWRGKPVLVTFWATDCPSCIQEVNDFIDLYQQFHSNGLEIIAIAMAYDPPNHVVEMTKMKQIPYPVALDLRSEHARAFGGVPFTPTTFLIDPAGNIVFSKVGRFDLTAMQQRLQQLLKKAQ